MEERKTGSLVDGRGRIAKKLRISVTDRCNFACLFCMPHKDRVRWIPRGEFLTFEEITQITRVLVSLGIEKVRVTGGEPLLREGIENLVERLCLVGGIKSLDMTTNGWFLAENAAALRKAGLRGITVSLHSIRPDRFAKIAGMKRDALSRVLDGIEAASAAGLAPVKLNSVAIRGYNEDEIVDIVEFARDKDLSLRFIEFMPLDGMGIWDRSKLVSGEEIISTVSKRHRLVPKGREPGDTATVYGFEDGKGELGVITPMTDPFCNDCDRIRLTAEGKLLTCLFDTNYYDLKPFIRNGPAEKSFSSEDVKRQLLSSFIAECIAKKPAGIAAYTPSLIREIRYNNRSMHAIGG